MKRTTFSQAELRNPDFTDHDYIGRVLIRKKSAIVPGMPDNRKRDKVQRGKDNRK